MINLEHVVINRVHENLFLGLFIDDKWQFDALIDLLRTKLSRNCYALTVIVGEID